MRSKSRQNWSVGAVVKVGFLSLTVVEVVSAGCYRLRSVSGAHYEFEPYRGLFRVWV